MATYTLSNDQLNDFRADLDIPADKVFTNTELNRLYNRAEGNYEYAVALGWRQMLADAAKKTDYKAAQSGETLSQMFDHIKYMIEYWTGLSGLGGFTLEGGLISLNTDATEDNREEWDGSFDTTEYPGYE